MTEQPSVETVILRLEAATEGSDALSWDIAEALGWAQFWCGQTIYVPPGELAEQVKRDPLSVSVVDLPGDCDATTEMPRYTTSIDAARSLLPPGPCLVGNLPSGRGFADLGTQKSLQCIEGATPALALCIAALKERQNVPQTDE